MQYAIIKTGGKQYKVSVGDTLNVELLGDVKTFVFDEVLLVVDGEKVEVGKPVLKDVKVDLKVVKDVEKGVKMEVYHFKAKSRYRKHTGFRPQFTRVKVAKIG